MSMQNIKPSKNSNYDALIDVALSVRENRAIALYPDTQSEQDAIDAELLAICEDSADETGNGYSGAEARGHMKYWGTTDAGNWSISVYRAPA